MLSLGAVMVIVLFAAVVVLYARLLYVLRHRHRETWTALGEPSLILNNSVMNSVRVQRFVWTREYRKLADRELTLLAGVLQFAALAYCVAFVLFAIGVS